MQKKQKVKNLHPNEIWLIKRMRNRYKYGEIVVIVQDGLPMCIKAGIMRDDPRDNNYEQGKTSNSTTIKPDKIDSKA